MKNQLSLPSHSSSAPRSNDFSNIVLDNTPNFFLVVDKDLRITYANRSAKEAIAKYLQNEIDDQTSILNLVPASRRPFLKNLYHEVLKGGERTSEFKVTTADGGSFYFENNFKPFRDNEGRIVGVIVSSFNVTEKKQAAKILQEAEQRWRFALESVDQSVWEWDVQNDKTMFSKSYSAMLGYEEDEIQGSFDEWQQKIHPQDKERVVSTVQQKLQGKEKHVEVSYRTRTKHGDYKYVQARGLVLRDENGIPVKMVGVHVDRTKEMEVEMELKRTYEEIRIANERFNYMMKATHDMIWDWDILHNNFYRGQDGLKKVYGLQNNEDIPTINELIRRVHPEDVPRVEGTIQNFLRSKDINSFELEYRFKKDDGSYSHVYDRGMVIRNESGDAVRVIGAAQDVSERKNLENEILNNELEYQRVLNKATIDSQEQERTQIGRELHDNVNQILTTTKLFLEVALTDDTKIDLVKRSIENISVVINEIRQLSRSLMDPSIHDLGIIDSISDLVENVNLTRKVKTYFDFDPTIQNVLNQNQKLVTFRIVQEAMNNILKHADATHAVITLSYDGTKVDLTIEDDGIGFDPTVVRKGSGLRNIKNRIYLINGTHSIESEPGKGCKLIATFNVSKNHLI